MSLTIRPTFTPSPQNETSVPMEQLWNARIVYFLLGLAVGSIATYFISKMWSPRETEAERPPLSGRATTQLPTSSSILSDGQNIDISQRTQDPTTPFPRLTATPTTPISPPPREPLIHIVGQEFRGNFEKVFGIIHRKGDPLTPEEKIDLILRNASQRNFNLPDFFKSDKTFIDLYLACQRTRELEEKALRVANNHLKWLLIKDALNTQKKVGTENGIPTPIPLEFSSLEEMEKAAGQIDQWKVTRAEKLRSIETLDLRNLDLISIPDFIGHLSSLKTLTLVENQFFAIPLSLALLPKSCTITIDGPLDSVSFNEEVRKTRLTHQHLGPKIIFNRTRDH